MESFKVEITKRETMKPSPPTPPHLKSHKFCMIDLLCPLIYVPQILFYKTTTHDDQATVVSRLRESLSTTLSLYYPLSGRLTLDLSSVDCNDQGIPFFEARAKGSLLAFLESSNRLDLLRHFIPHDLYDSDENGISSDGNKALLVTKGIPLVVQITAFESGGVAIGYQWLHKIIDGASWGNFLQTWAAIASGRDKDVIAPDFAAGSSIFPPCSEKAPLTPEKFEVYQPYVGIPEDSRCIIKAFSFSPHAIAALKDEAKSEHVLQPTRVEVVTGFIWKHAMAAASKLSKLKSESLAPSALFHPVDVRPFTTPAMPSTAIGNLVNPAITHWNVAQEPILELHELVAKLRKCIYEAKDRNFISKLQGDSGTAILCDHFEKLQNVIKGTNLNSYKFTSWMRNKLGFNADFGFGILVWIGYFGGRVDPQCKNAVTLIENVDKGIEAWMVLDEEEMKILENDSKFLQFGFPIN